MRVARWLAGSLALLLAVQPTLVVAANLQSFDDVYQGYLRGEVSLGEMEAARQRHNQAAAAQALPQVVPAAPDAADLASEILQEDAREGEGLGQKVKKIGAWVRDIPKRTLRRFAPDDEGLATAEDAQKLVESSIVPAYTANAAQREADSTWVRPVKVTAQAEVDKVQSVIQRVVAFGGLTALSKALAGDQAAKAVVQKATKVVGRLDAGQKKALVSSLSTGSFRQMVSKLIVGKPTTALGKVVKDGFGNNILLAVAASGVVQALLNDGLDLDTLKDHLVALNAIEGRRTHRENLLVDPLMAVGYYHMDKAASGAFQSLWTKATSGSGSFANLLKGADSALRRAGAGMVKAPPAHLAEKAASFGRQAASLGLPGVSGATSLSLMGAAESIFKAGTLGLVGMPILDTSWRVIAGEREGVVIGGNREKTFAMYNFFDTYYQRTGNKWKDAVEERKNSVANLWEGYERWPFYHSMNWFLRFVGGYAGAVIASSVVAPVGFASFGISLVVSAIFAEGGVAIGKWAGAKIDASPAMMRRIRGKNMEKIFRNQLENPADTPARRQVLEALAELDRLRAEIGVRSQKDLLRVLQQGGPDSRRLAEAAQRYATLKRAYLDDLFRNAEERAGDFEKMVKGSQVNSRIHYVRSFDDVTLSREKGYVQMEFPGFRKHASPRYDLVTAEGRRGVWDHRTNRVIDVGKISENNGNRIAFLDDAGVEVKDGVLQTKDKSELEKAVGNVFVTTNGIIFEKALRGSKITKGKKKGLRKSEWLLRGYGGEYDIVLRQSGRRFAWNGSQFLEVGSAAQIAAKAAEEATRKQTEASLPEKKRRKKAKAEAKEARSKAKTEAKDEAFAQKLHAKLRRKIAREDRPSDTQAVQEALADLGRLYKASGENLGERFGKALLARR